MSTLTRRALFKLIAGFGLASAAGLRPGAAQANIGKMTKAPEKDLAFLRGNGQRPIGTIGWTPPPKEQPPITWENVTAASVVMSRAKRWRICYPDANSMEEPLLINQGGFYWWLTLTPHKIRITADTPIKPYMIANALDNMFVNGDGCGMPRGVLDFVTVEKNRWIDVVGTAGKRAVWMVSPLNWSENSRDIVLAKHYFFSSTLPKNTAVLADWSHYVVCTSGDILTRYDGAQYMAEMRVDGAPALLKAPERPPYPFQVVRW